MRSRAIARLVAAFVFALSAFGATGPGTFTVSVAGKTVVSARQSARRLQHLPTEPSAYGIPLRLERTAARRPDVRRPTLDLPHSIFQRPPPTPSPIRA